MACNARLETPKANGAGRHDLTIAICAVGSLPSSRGLGRGPFKAKTGVRIPVGALTVWGVPYTIYYEDNSTNEELQRERRNVSCLKSILNAVRTANGVKRHIRKSPFSVSICTAFDF